MRVMLLISFLITLQSSKGQAIRFQLKQLNACDKEGTIDSSGYLLIDENDSIYRNEAGTCVLAVMEMFMSYWY